MVFKTAYQLITDYLSEEEYFDYYQNARDPTFENYPFKMKADLVATDEISYCDTAIDIMRQRKKLEIMTWVDFIKFVSDWVFHRPWDSSHRTLYKNEGIALVTIKTDDQIGQIKCIWMIRKYSSNRPIGVKLVRELHYALSLCQATKGIIVTTSRLTKDALKLIDKK